jgi:hypothetical protein
MKDRMPEPIFTADRNDPEDMAALGRIFGGDAIREASEAGAFGFAENITQRAAMEGIKQLLRKHVIYEPSDKPECEK